MRSKPAVRETFQARAFAWLVRDELPERPRYRGDCVGGERPCPWVGCKWHLATDVMPNTGSLKNNFPDVPVGEWPNSCALDVADYGGMSLEDVGELMNLTRERVRQIETIAIQRLMRVPSRREQLVALLEGWRDATAAREAKDRTLW